MVFIRGGEGHISSSSSKLFSFGRQKTIKMRRFDSKFD
jgi:hypothetical protein